MSDTTELKQPELKRCPFCGKLPSLAKWETLNIACLNEKCPVAPEVWGDTQSEAISRWNTRTDPVKQALVEALQNELERCRCAGTGLWSYTEDQDKIDCAECAPIRAALDLARK